MSIPRRAIGRLALALFVTAGVAALACGQNPITRVSVDDAGVQGDRDSMSYWPRTSVSGDGRFVAFDSQATNLVAGDVDGIYDVFVYDRVQQTIACMSVDSSGAPAWGFAPSISRDGRFVAFASENDNLVANDGNRHKDVFVRDRDPDGNGIFDEGNGVTTIVSLDSAGNSANDDSYEPAISADGSTVAFTSVATNLLANDANFLPDVFVHDLATGTTVCASVDPYGAMSTGSLVEGGSFGTSLSADGKLVVFTSWAWNLIANDTNFAPDVYVRDVAAAATTRVSVDSKGNEADDYSGGAALSADGRFVVFTSRADDLVAGDHNLHADVFEHDRTTGATVRVSTTSTGGETDRDSGEDYWYWVAIPSALSSDGRFTVFASEATNLVPGDDNGAQDLFVHDASTGATNGVTFNAGGHPGDLDSYRPAVSDDGSIVGFVSAATNLVGGDTNGVIDAFAWDATITPPLAAWSNYGAGLAGTGGVPSLTSQDLPKLDVDVSIDVANSLGRWTIGFLCASASQGSLPVKGGTLLLGPLAFFEAFVLPPAGLTFTIHVPDDPDLLGTSVFAQVVEVDAGAVQGFSFTPGIEFDFGR
jgi:Tol biopolymer transport system component